VSPPDPDRCPLCSRALVHVAENRLALPSPWMSGGWATQMVAYDADDVGGEPHARTCPDRGAFRAVRG
jgi:hypothetical protein